MSGKWRDDHCQDVAALPRCPVCYSKTDAACNVAPSIHDRYMIDIDT